MYGFPAMSSLSCHARQSSLPLQECERPSSPPVLTLIFWDNQLSLRGQASTVQDWLPEIQITGLNITRLPSQWT